ncbi:hypothetical protein HJC23_007316 [Cyclotella cryptica]|uniref:Uncharacterized protein n=1 Tax=Cyclotella cryptica TaxID=29204 RepID=A0ABD3NXD2_9STRA|eukprot:CCRYP_019296-RA/>CCRYP_019296-RA protein AED:0.23 eAED:0.23 QI:0/-1/0/1/-1/1/1/0/379
MIARISRLTFIYLISICDDVIISPVHALATESSRAQTARSRLAEAFRSPSGKLTLHPELVLPEPSDPTALLLRATEVTKLSSVLRTKAKANGLFVEGTVDALAPMGKEQESARGNFPGPVPIVYSWTNSDKDEGTNDLKSRLERLSKVDGVEGVLIPFCVANGIESFEGYQEIVNGNPNLKELCGEIWAAGMQPIPEIVVATGTEWSEDEVVRLVDAIKDTCGGVDPVSIVFTKEETDRDEEEAEDAHSVPEITIPESLSQRLAFVGSVRTTAGDGRMNYALSQLSSCNFNGAFLRADCVPGYRLNPDLNVVGGFWSAALSDLKSLKSKNFSFRSKVKLEKDAPMEWYNYQKDVMESGALGLSGGPSGLNTAAGDYKGF